MLVTLGGVVIMRCVYVPVLHVFATRFLCRFERFLLLIRFVIMFSWYISLLYLVYTLPCPKNCMAMTMVLRTMQIMTDASNHLCSDTL